MFELTRRNNKHVGNYYNPFREMEEFEKKFFGNPFDNFFTSHDLAEFKTDIIDEGDHYTLEADLPGFDKDNIHVDLSGDTLTIKAERNSKVEEKDKENKIIRRERSYGSYCREFDVSGINTDGIKSKYKNGVLTLTLPKKDEKLPEPKHLEIE
jgi:HSP20 family protein